MKKQSLLFCSALLSVALVLPAQAAAPKNLGKFGYWVAYQMTEGNHSVCYMSLTAKPPAKAGSKAKRGDVVLMVTHRPAESSLDVVSYTAGVKFKPATDVTVQAGSKTFSLFTQDDTAWSRDSSTDHVLSAALRTSPLVTISGQAANGQAIADTVNLKGSAEAYRAMSKACGLQVEEPKPAPKADAKSSGKTKIQKKH